MHPIRPMRPVVFAAVVLASGALASGALAQPFPCSGGTATDAGGTSYACEAIDLLSRLTPQDLGAPTFSQCPQRACLNDIWGWTDPASGREYALVGVSNGTAFVDVTDPLAPVRLGHLPTATGPSTWRDIKVASNHAYIVSEAGGHGMQIFDLTRLRGLSEDASRTFTADGLIGTFNSHNVAVDVDAGRAYVVGGRCSGGLDVYSLANPKAPADLGCFAGEGYSHDAQCVTYNGPDSDHTGKQICFGFNENRVVIVDMTNPASPVSLSTAFYPSAGYTHQGWLTDDGRHLIVNDEGDETFGQATRTIVMDVEDLDSPDFDFIYTHNTNTVDHNLYVQGRYIYEANYNHGLRILDADQIDADVLTLVAQFDTFPASPDGFQDDFDGAWSVYPYFESGNLIVSDQVYGLFVLRPTNLVVGTSPEAPDGRLTLGAPSPNPTSGETVVRVAPPEAGAVVRVSVIDALGREIVVVHEGPLAREADVPVRVDNLPTGAYRVRAVVGADAVTVPLVVTR